MFEQSLLLESSGASHHSNRGWTTAASLVLQVFVISALAIVPILYPQALQLAQHQPQIPIFSSAPQPVNQVSTQHSSATPSQPVIFVRTNSLTYGHHIETADTLPQATVDYMLAKIPMGRPCKIEEVAALAHFLASRESGFCTGQCYDISGGRATY